MSDANDPLVRALLIKIRELTGVALNGKLSLKRYTGIMRALLGKIQSVRMSLEDEDMSPKAALELDRDDTDMSQGVRANLAAPAEDEAPEDYDFG